MSKPAERLAGQRISNAWTVVKKWEKKDDETGGAFSTGYEVVHDDGRRGFLKAIDFSVPAGHPDAAQYIQDKTRLFTFEREILEKCRDERLRRVVVAVEHGQLTDGAGAPIVSYLIFELADGNLHYRERFVKEVNDAFVFRVAHHVATGLWQVHQRGIAHLDMKPSNVLFFNDFGSKIADFGRSSVFGSSNPLPHEEKTYAGDPSHAPIELLYGYVLPDWHVRRFSCDLYLMGSLVIQLLSDVQLTAQILSRLPKDMWPSGSGPTFAKALPQIRDVYEKILSEIVSGMPDIYGPTALETLKELTDPEPERRGALAAGRTSADQYSMQRYVSRFNLLATRSQFRVVKRDGN